MKRSRAPVTPRRALDAPLRATHPSPKWPSLPIPLPWPALTAVLGLQRPAVPPQGPGIRAAIWDGLACSWTLPGWKPELLSSPVTPRNYAASPASSLLTLQASGGWTHVSSQAILPCSGVWSTLGRPGWVGVMVCTLQPTCLPGPWPGASHPTPPAPVLACRLECPHTAPPSV